MRGKKSPPHELVEALQQADRGATSGAYPASVYQSTSLTAPHAQTAQVEEVAEAQQRGLEVSFVIKIITSAKGIRTPGDGQYVVEYVPAPMSPQGDYLPGGKLVTTPDIDKAKTFATPFEAYQYYRQSNGLRPDGKPNRPLTAWHCEFARKEKTK